MGLRFFKLVGLGDGGQVHVVSERGMEVDKGFVCVMGVVT